MYGPEYETFEPRRNAQIREDKHNGAKAAALISVILICVCLLCLMLLFMLPQISGIRWKNFINCAFVNGEIVEYDAERIKSVRLYEEYLASDKIYPGVSINGIDVGGLSREEALNRLGSTSQGAGKTFSVTVIAGDHSWNFSPANVPVSANYESVVERAFALGRSGTVYSEKETLFEQRCNAVARLREEPVNLRTDYDFDRDAVRIQVQGIADYVNRSPVNAQIESFDFNKRSFGFSQSSPGCEIDTEELYSQVCEAISQSRSGAVITARLNITEPEVTTEALTVGFGLRAAYTTKTTSDEDRNTNIRLACEAINGTALMPGEAFSFNGATGERTTEKGYRSAGAISRGQSIEEVGGGICQVSSTLFNAAARANLSIVTRSPHAWPSTYVTIGQDATVNWPDLDFKFKNDTEYPVFIITYYKSRKMSAEIWGMTLGDGVSIDLESFVTQTTTAPGEPKYVYNGSLHAGESKTTVKARDGYLVETYKVWYLNGKETKREKAYTSNYKAYQEVIEYNWGEQY